MAQTLSIHAYFIRRSHDEFTEPISHAILGSILTISLAQLPLTIALLV